MEYKSKILIVDDEQEILDTYEELLSHLSSKPQVFTANSGKKAIALLDNGDFDLIICDIRMPEMDGFQVLSIVRRRFPDLRIIVFTALADDSYRDRAYGLGIDMYWQKPTTQKETEMFLDCVEALLSQEKTNGFRGIQSKNLVDIIQLECMCGNSTTLRIKSGAVEAKIYIKDGEIIDAEIGELRGEIAFKKILKLKSGAFEFLPIPSARERTIFTSYHGLLLDAAQTIDEIQTDDKSQLPEASEVGDRSALENPLSIISKSKGVVFVMEGEIEEGKILETHGLGDFDSYHQWMVDVLKTWETFSAMFALGGLKQIQALTPHESMVAEQFENRYLCVGFNPEIKKERLDELMKKNIAIWIS